MADVLEVRVETPTARTIRLRLPGLTGHLAGQHIDVRLTAEDGYSAVRSYSVASALPGDELEITVEELADGEVSPYLVTGLSPGDRLEVRGPIGGWFVWRPEDHSPVQLIAGGSGVVPLMAMIRAHEASANPSEFRLLYSVRDPESAFYRSELESMSRSSHRFTLTWVYTRRVPPGWPTPAGRLDAATLESVVFPPGIAPAVYVCGATGFVEAIADRLVQAGHSPDRIRAERYGGMDGSS
ncbi:ferredoxin reductase [Cryobacterium sp. PH31-AA6]|uniref:ferredoxin reductase n=1 Tax=Cryobacterium sp. PH31-AA6 TaxID=3046205 RepID=UPI0024BB2106|nr:ferredoxin reductase [Cryobacterium sp. PH31-AA6]MDJ0323240.1 ferredoxin reductase [Cryobacterium sp. PH31-AA6]